MKLKKIKLNVPITIYILLFIFISIISIYSSMTYLPNYLGNLALKQLYFYLTGIILMLVITKISKQTIYKYAWYIYLANIILLLLLLIIAKPINNSRCWFIIPGIGSFQPSEFMKIALIILTSVITGKWIETNKKSSLFSELVLLVKVGIIFFIPSILTFLEPDTGAVFIYFIIITSILLVSPIRKRWFIFLIFLIVTVITVFLAMYFFNQELFIKLLGTNLFYRIDRLLDWKNGTGMQLENSLTAIGSSDILGHGYNKTPIYFPESGTDFIFAVYASNFGLIGSIILLLIILGFDCSLIKLYKKTNNINDKLVLAATIGILLYQQFQNIGMTLGIIPITGITLPFISYGGSSLISYLILLSLIYNIYSETYKTIN